MGSNTEILRNTTARPCSKCGAGPGTLHAKSCNGETVDHPAHYGGVDNPYEAIKVFEAWHGPEATRWFCILSAEKYLSRMGKKPGEPMARDLAKAVWYLQYAAKLSGT